MVNYVVGGELFDIFLPIYMNDSIIQDTGWYPLLIPIYIFQIINFLGSFTLIYATQKALCSGSSCHPNLQRIAIFLTIHCYFLVSVRVILFAYHPLRVLQISGIFCCDIPLLAAALINFYLMGFFIFSVPVIVFERFLATRFAREYERNTRTHLSNILLTVNITLSTIFAVFMLFHFIKATVSLPLLGFPVLASLLAYVKIYSINNRSAERLMKNKVNRDGFYSLSLRFQITENIKSLQLLRAIIWTASLMILIGIFLYAFPRLVILPKASETILGQFFNALVDTLIDMFPNVVIITGWIRVRKWGRYLVSDLPREITEPPSNASFHVYFDDLPSAIDKTTQIYFTQLRQSWG